MKFYLLLLNRINSLGKLALARLSEKFVQYFFIIVAYSILKMQYVFFKTIDKQIFNEI